MKVTENPSMYAFPRSILGTCFVSPGDIANSCRGVTYTDEQFAFLGANTPSKDVVGLCCENKCILAAGPPKEMSLLGLRAGHRDIFDIPKDGWYGKKQSFARTEHVHTRWIICRYRDCRSLFLPAYFDLVSLNAVEAIWCLLCYQYVHGVPLSTPYIRTSSADSEGGSVYVQLNRGKLVVCRLWAGLFIVG